MVARRDYRVGAGHLGSLWPRVPAPRWSLPSIADAMAQPRFVPYLGRKGCPLGLSLAPSLQEAADPATALLTRHQRGPEAGLRAAFLNERAGAAPSPVLIALDATDAGHDTRSLRVETRRDQPRSRRRWQFDPRQEAVLGVTGL